MKKPSTIILGIDPGTLVIGYCIIEVAGNRMTVCRMDVLKLNARQDNYQRLQLIYAKVQELIAGFGPRHFAIEAPFFGKNVQSMLKLGRAQGVAIAAAIGAGLEVCEYSPRKIKQSITGNGNAGKEQVWKMLQQILPLQQEPLKYYDASDALAVAVCHHFQLTAPGRQETNAPAGKNRTPASKKNRGWEEFIALNPERVSS